MPSPEQVKREGANDVGEWGEKDTSGAYAEGTVFELADGTKVDPAKVKDHIGAKVKNISPR